MQVAGKGPQKGRSERALAEARMRLSRASFDRVLTLQIKYEPVKLAQVGRRVVIQRVRLCNPTTRFVRAHRDLHPGPFEDDLTYFVGRLLSFRHSETVQHKNVARVATLCGTEAEVSEQGRAR